uniref:Uncharacterized protein n=1 Tax=viral metagenome TaxID=1070528 RepID=A0A6M3LSG7_9ZZZZ
MNTQKAKEHKFCCERCGKDITRRRLRVNTRLCMECDDRLAQFRDDFWYLRDKIII